MDPMSEYLENATQGATEPVETVPQPAIETPDTGTETTAAAPVEETAEEKARKGAQKRINELTREKYEERRQRQALEAVVTRLRAAPAPQAQTPAPEGFVPVAEVQKIILQLKSRGIGIVVTDHNVRETLRIVDRAYLIHKGKVLAEGSGDFLIQDDQARKFYLGEDFNL